MGQDQSKSGLEPGGWAIYRSKSGPARPINKPRFRWESDRSNLQTAVTSLLIWMRAVWDSERAVTSVLTFDVSETFDWMLKEWLIWVLCWWGLSQTIYNWVFFMSDQWTILALMDRSSQHSQLQQAYLRALLSLSFCFSFITWNCLSSVSTLIVRWDAWDCEWCHTDVLKKTHWE